MFKCLETWFKHYLEATFTKTRPPDSLDLSKLFNDITIQ